WALSGKLVANDNWQNPADAWRITLIEQLAEQIVRKSPDGIDACIKWLHEQPQRKAPLISLAVLNGVAKGFELQGTGLAKVITQPISPWNALLPAIPSFADAAIRIVKDSNALLESRRCAIDLVGRLRREQDGEFLRSRLTKETDRPIQ